MCDFSIVHHVRSYWLVTTQLTFITCGSTRTYLRIHGILLVISLRKHSCKWNSHWGRCTRIEPDSWYLFNHCHLQGRCISPPITASSISSKWRYVCPLSLCYVSRGLNVWTTLTEKVVSIMVWSFYWLNFFVDMQSKVLEFSFPCMACHGFFIKIAKYNPWYSFLSTSLVHFFFLNFVWNHCLFIFCLEGSFL